MSSSLWLLQLGRELGHDDSCKAPKACNMFFDVEMWQRLLTLQVTPSHRSWKGAGRSAMISLLPLTKLVSAWWSCSVSIGNWLPVFKKKKGSEALNDLTLKMINRRIPVLLQMIYHYYTIAIESTGAYSQVKILLGFHARDWTVS